MSITIGIDFDNTIICYDELVYEVSREYCTLPSGIAHDKTVIRDFIRASAGGDLLWQRIQGQIYGPRILGAQISEGFSDFVSGFRAREVMLYVVSHKTQFGHFDESKTDLRLAALRWMEAHKFFTSDGLGFSPDRILFGSTRTEKLAHIRTVGCQVFIDDLIEVFAEEDFPQECRKILYGSAPGEHCPPEIERCATWQEVTKTALRLF